MLEGLKRIFREIANEVSTRTLSDEEIRKIVEDFKLKLVANDVAVEAAERLGGALAEKLQSIRLKRFGKDSREIIERMSAVLDSVLKEADVEKLLLSIKEKQARGEPFVMLFVGPNGCGKTTTIVKIARYLKDKGYSSLIAAADTFRAGAIEQLTKLAKSAGIKVVSQRYGADPAAVAMDAIMSAKTTRIPVVLIDTAGRTEVDKNLLEEMRKIKRVANPDVVIYIGDALAGNAAVEQARRFDEYVGIDYIVLSKLDADARGGSALSISHLLDKPMLFVGVGQGLGDLKVFSKDLIKSSITLS